jgi:hypothetical protein
MTDNLENFPRLANWIKEHCAKHKEPFVRESIAMIEYALDLDIQIPEKYGWRYSDVDSIKKQIGSVSSHEEINRIFWQDQARNVEAYSTMSFWRGIELVKTAIRSLNNREVISPAVLARSALELACYYLDNSRNLDTTLDKLEFPPNTRVMVEGIEEMIVKMIWGTRLGDPEPHLQQTNVLTSIKRLAKNPRAKDILPLYEYLCEIAHPNVIGNTRFWSHIDQVYPDGSQRRVISRSAESEITEEILDKTLWGLGWSSAAYRNSFEMTAAALQKLLSKLNGEQGA